MWSDFAEFVAGSNPTNPNSLLETSLALQPNQRVRLQWPTVPGRSYSLESSTNLTDWVTVMQWTRASGASQAQLLSQPAVTTMYRVKVMP